MKITILRPFNVYGTGQKEVFLIPEIINQLISSEKEIIEVDDLEPKRDYIYIDDLIFALILSINNKDDIYNIGSGYSVSVEDIIKTAIKKSGIEKKYLSRNIKRKNEIYDVVADISKIKNNLHWSLKTPFEKGIENCINYYFQKFQL
jgi:nucleoside-diphosphate-sugar epimerase